MVSHAEMGGSCLGLSDYGLRYAPHVKHFLKAGFRVIIPDLPSVSKHVGPADRSMDDLQGMQRQRAQLTAVSIRISHQLDSSLLRSMPSLPTSFATIWRRASNSEKSFSAERESCIGLC